MDVDGGSGGKRTLYVGTHALSHRREGMEVRGRGAAGIRLPACQIPRFPLHRLRPQCVQATRAALPSAAQLCTARARSHSMAVTCHMYVRTRPLVCLQIVSPFQEGVISDWEAAEGLLEHALKCGGQQGLAPAGWSDVPLPPPPHLLRRRGDVDVHACSTPRCPRHSRLPGCLPRLRPGCLCLFPPRFSARSSCPGASTAPNRLHAPPTRQVPQAADAAGHGQPPGHVGGAVVQQQGGAGKGGGAAVRELRLPRCGLGRGNPWRRGWLVMQAGRVAGRGWRWRAEPEQGLLARAACSQGVVALHCPAAVLLPTLCCHVPEAACPPPNLLPWPRAPLPPAAVFMAKNAVLSSFASGRQTSLVVDAGHERTVGEPAACCVSAARANRGEGGGGG